MSSNSQNSGCMRKGSPYPQQNRHFWIITGPAGCGKTTVAEYLAQQLSLPYIEGDKFHPRANIEKMDAGIPLTDADRWDWLILLRQQALMELARPVPGVILTCSALKRKYRDVLRIAAYGTRHIYVHFIYLRANEDMLLSRVNARQGHYMRGDMVKSQVESLEEPAADERDCVCIDVSGTVSEVQQLVLCTVKEALKQVVDEVQASSRSRL